MRVINVKTIVTVGIIVLLSLIIANHFFKDLFKLYPFYRNKILLEGFDGKTAPAAAPATAPMAPVSDTDKSTIMADLFEKVNTQMDTIRTIDINVNKDEWIFNCKLTIDLNDIRFRIKNYD